MGYLPRHIDREYFFARESCESDEEASVNNEENAAQELSDEDVELFVDQVNGILDCYDNKEISEDHLDFFFDRLTPEKQQLFNRLQKEHDREIEDLHQMFDEMEDELQDFNREMDEFNREMDEFKREMDEHKRYVEEVNKKIIRSRGVTEWHNEKMRQIDADEELQRALQELDSDDPDYIQKFKQAVRDHQKRMDKKRDNERPKTLADYNLWWGS